MAIDRGVQTNLRKYATAFREARDKGANEADTVMYVVKFFEELLGYESLKGEISKEFSIKDKYCDLALKIDGTARILVECKAASIKVLLDKHIEQAENYAARAGISWVVLTNGIEWRLYHLTFAENEGIAHDLAFELNLLDGLEADANLVWERLQLLAKDSVMKNSLEEYWSQKKALSPASIVKALFNQDVLLVVRRELNRNAPARLEVQDVFNAIRDVLSKDALLEVGDINIKKSRKRRRRVQKTDAVTGLAITVEVEDEVDAAEGQGVPMPPQTAVPAEKSDRPKPTPPPV